MWVFQTSSTGLAGAGVYPPTPRPPSFLDKTATKGMARLCRSTIVGAGPAGPAPGAAAGHVPTRADACPPSPLQTAVSSDRLRGYQVSLRLVWSAPSGCTPGRAAAGARAGLPHGELALHRAGARHHLHRSLKPASWRG